MTVAAAPHIPGDRAIAQASGRPRERGVALIVVLWGIAALSLIALAMLSATLSRANIGRNAWYEAEARTAADAGVQGAILSLFDPDPRDRQQLDGSEHSLAVLSDTVTVSIRDEAGLIDLNAAAPDLLRDYLQTGGLDTGEAAQLAGRIAAWRAPEGAPAHPFQSVDDVLLIQGMTADLLRKLRPGLTVYGHHANFDTRYAPREVLAIIPGMAGASADAAIAARQPSAGLTAHAYTIVATAERHGARFSRRAVVLLTGDPARPYWILDWR